MLVAQAVALFVDRNRDAVRAKNEENFKNWKSDDVANTVARSNGRADTVRWIEDQIGLKDEQRAPYDQLQDNFTMRVFLGGVECMAKKLVNFYGNDQHDGSGLVLKDDLIIEEQIEAICANRPGRLHPIQMSDRNERAGYYFFSDSTMKFFQSRIETSCTDHGVFITSERYDNDPRHYMVRVFHESGDVSTVSEKIGTIEHAREIMLIVDALISMK